MKTALGILAASLLFASPASAQDLPEIRERGVLRHLGVVYAHFVTGSGDGLSVELIQGFAQHLGLRYEYVATTWNDVMGDLIGREFTRKGNEVHLMGPRPIRGDLISNGLTRLPWRETLIDYSEPTFPTQVWAIVRADSPLMPIRPTGDEAEDTRQVKALLREKAVLCMPGTCLDPALYDFTGAGIEPVVYQGNMNELVPRLLNSPADATILDVPDALLAIRSWPGEIKILGPISPEQVMGVGFRKTSPQLQAAFARYMAQIRADGTYERLLKKYYPTVFAYYPKFFQGKMP